MSRKPTHFTRFQRPFQLHSVLPGLEESSVSCFNSGLRLSFGYQKEANYAYMPLS